MSKNNSEYYKGNNMDKLSLIQQYVTCPFCKSDIEINDMQLTCKGCGKLFNIIHGDIPSMLGSVTIDTKFSMAKWDEIYLKDFFLKESEREYKQLFLDDAIRQISEYTNRSPKETKTYLEIGCGQGFSGEELAKDGWLFIGVDFSLNALRSLKERLNNRGIENYLLIHGDIQSLPIRSNSIDLIYGGGVIEHFMNTQVVINHIFRVLTKGGISFNTVPSFNIGNLSYRSLWGGIPNVPILKQLAELVHLKILRGKHMVFGYELQFTNSQLKRLHINAGFKADNIAIDRFDCHVQLHRINNCHLKKFLTNLCKKNRQFWPMVKVIGIKK